MYAQRKKKKKKKSNHHDALFKDIFSNKKYCLDIFRLVLTPTEFRLFKWKTLKSEATLFLDEKWKERRADLIFSVKLASGKSVRIVFLLEHKSGQDPSLLKQLLEYQTHIYAKKRGTAPIDEAIIPIVVYHGQEKRWKGPLRFQDSIKGLSQGLRQHFGKNILDFSCRLLNLQDVPSWKKKPLTTSPILFIMASIWRVKESTFPELFQLARGLDEKERRKLLVKAMNYLHHHNSRKFSWKKLEEIEAKFVKNKGERIMPALKSFLEIEHEKGIEKGIEKGREEGLQKVALKMLKSGFSVEIIKENTGLSKDKIKALKRLKTKK